MDTELSGYEMQENAQNSNKVKPISTELAPPQSSKKAAIRKTWNTFVESSTLHGLQYVFSGQTSVRRVLWALFLLLAISWFSVQSFKLLKKYYSYPITTKVSLKYEAAPDFPAVTICNFNMFKNSVVKTSGLDQLFKQLYVILSESLGLPTVNDSIDLSKYEDFNITQLYFDAGHHINDTLLKCNWNGKPTCDYRNFTPVLTSMGLCHTFNSGKGGQSILQIKQAGANHGLHLMLNVRQDEYHGIEAYLAGLKVLIHHQHTLPLVSQLGFAVAPGTSTFAAIRKQRVLILPKPFEGDCHDKAITGIPGHSKYTMSSCKLICETKFVLHKCGCRDALMPNINNTKVCGVREIRNCLLKERISFQDKTDDQCDCQTPCDSISFKPVLSYAAFPSNDYVARVHEVQGLLQGVVYSRDVLKKAQEVMRQNMLELRVYFQELNYQVIEETPAYDFASLLGEIGGQVGLCVGASLLTVLEFCDVLLTIFGIQLRFR